MSRLSSINRARRWKMERASVHKKGKSQRPRSNKYSGGDKEAKPKKHARQQIWVGGYTKSNGTHVKGYVRHNAQYKK